MAGVQTVQAAGGQRRFWITVVWFSLATGLFATWVASGYGGSRVTDTVDNLGQLLAPLAAACACGWAARRVPATRTAWSFLAASSLSWGMGQAVWCYYDLIRRIAVPFPSLADVGYLTAVPLAVVGLLSFPGGIRRTAFHIRSLMDGLLIAGSLLFVSWALVLGPIYRTHQGGLLKQVLSMSYPAGDVVLVSLVVMIAVQSGNNQRASLMLVMAGIVAFAVSDTSFAYLTEVNNYGVGGVLDTGWVAGYLLIVLGALWSLTASPGRLDGRVKKRVTAPSVLAPYVLPALAGAIAMERLVQGRAFGLFLALEGFALLGLLAIRQIIMLLDNVALNGQLHTEVELGTAELRMREARFSALVEHSSDVITIVDAGSTIMYQSPSIGSALGWTSDELQGRRFADLLHSDDRSRWPAVASRLLADPEGEVTVEWRLHHTGGTWRTFQSVVTNLLAEAGVAGFVINSRDVTDQRALEDQLRAQAFHDPLTGLANGALFAEHLEQAARRRGRSGGSLEVMIVDLDNFGVVNEQFGHAAGDELLREVAGRLQANFRDADAIARLGGDEFGVLFEDPTGRMAPGPPAERLLASFTEPFALLDQVVRISSSIGVADNADDCANGDELMRCADLAMYAAKAKGKQTYVVYTTGLHSSKLDDIHLEQELREALDRGQFELYYQPIVHVGTGRIAGVEALIRWNHPERGVVPPALFISVAEASGLIVAIGAWVLRQACCQMQEWDCRIGTSLRLSVNVSPRQLEDPDFSSTVQGIVEDTGFDPRRLTLEVTESLFADNSGGRSEILTEIRSCGMKIAIDDFGTGYSSLALLRDMPVDILKIDKAFIDHIVDDPDSARLVRTILQLSDDFHLTTVAEGAEHRDQVVLLRAWGCPFVQGYYFSEPLRDWELEPLLIQECPFGTRSRQTQVPAIAAARARS